MSRYIDPEDLSEEDLVYIAQRPSLRQEFTLQGYDDPLADFDFTVMDPNHENYGKTQAEVRGEEPQDDEGETEPQEDEDLPEDQQWTPEMTKGELREVIANRNQDREDDDKIDEPASDATKDEIIAVLVADDKDLAGEE